MFLRGCLEWTGATGTVWPLKPIFPVEAFEISLAQWNISRVMKSKKEGISPAQDLALILRTFPMILNEQACGPWGLSSLLITTSWK